MNMGGYPIWQRKAVEMFYYPYLLFNFIVILALTWTAGLRLLQQMQIRRIWSLLLLCWVMLAGCLGLLFANNLTNVIDGRPIHYHDWDAVRSMPQGHR